MDCGECGFNGEALTDELISRDSNLADALKEIERLKERVNELADVLADFDRAINKADLSTER